MSDRDAIEKRQAFINQIVLDEKKQTQKQVLSKARKKYTTLSLSTVKRDLHCLGIRTGPDGLEFPDEADGKKTPTINNSNVMNQLNKIFKIDPPKFIQTNQNGLITIFISFKIGSSTEFVAKKILELFNTRILGTIPGNRIVLVIFKGANREENILKELKALVK